MNSFNENVPISSRSNSKSKVAESDSKISEDLITLKEKMELLDTMLHPPDLAAPKLSVKTNDAVKAVVGFLDACAPRMIELVEACTTANFEVLSEEVFGDVLECNDRLQKLLSDFDERMETETTASTTAAKADGNVVLSAPSDDELEDDDDDNIENNNVDVTASFNDLLLDDNPFTTTAEGQQLQRQTAGLKSTGESDEFTTPAPAAPSSSSDAIPTAATPAPAVNDDDSFDDVFGDWTTASNK